MISFVNYLYYTDTYLGSTIPEDSFDALALRASEKIERLTFGQASEDEDYETEIQDAACSIAEVLYQEQQGDVGGIQSERVGDHSVTYVAGAEQAATTEEKVEATARWYLAATGLMYKGVA